jgi:hypothetical protein
MSRKEVKAPRVSYFLYVNYLLARLRFFMASPVASHTSSFGSLFSNPFAEFMLFIYSTPSGLSYLIIILIHGFHPWLLVFDPFGVGIRHSFPITGFHPMILVFDPFGVGDPSLIPYHGVSPDDISIRLFRGRDSSLIPYHGFHPMILVFDLSGSGFVTHSLSRGFTR